MIRRLSLFDLDNTLLDGDSDYTWAQHLIDLGILERASYEARNDQFFEDYKAGRLDIEAFLEFQLAPLARYPTATLESWRADFVARRIQPMVLPGARALVAERLARGDLVAIVTATNSFVTRPIAELFGVTHLIATEPEISGGRYTGRSGALPCYREGKVTRLGQFLEKRGESLADYAESWFYSDSHNDLPLLRAVRSPVAVRPDPILRVVAEQEGWPILELREDSRA